MLIEHAHKTRVKGVAPLSTSVAEQAAGLAVSASTDGVVKLWGLPKSFLWRLPRWITNLTGSQYWAHTKH